MVTRSLTRTVAEILLQRGPLTTNQLWNVLIDDKARKNTSATMVRGVLHYLKKMELVTFGKGGSAVREWRVVSKIAVNKYLRNPDPKRGTGEIRCRRAGCVIDRDKNVYAIDDLENATVSDVMAAIGKEAGHLEAAGVPVTHIRIGERSDDKPVKWSSDMVWRPDPRYRFTEYVPLRYTFLFDLPFGKHRRRYDDNPMYDDYQRAIEAVMSEDFG